MIFDAKFEPVKESMVGAVISEIHHHHIIAEKGGRKYRLSIDNYSGQCGHMSSTYINVEHEPRILLSLKRVK